MEFLKKALGDELYTQVESKLKGNDEIKLANLASGEYVSKGKHDADLRKVSDERDELKKQASDAATKLTELEAAAGDSAELKQKIQEMQEQHKNNVKELEEKSKKALKDHKVDLAIVAAGPTDATATKAIKALLNSEAISLDGDNLIGISEQIEKLKKESAYLFAGTASGNTDPANPKKPDDDGSTDDALTDDQLFEKRMADRNKG